jgi:hypothetical protein
MERHFEINQREFLRELLEVNLSLLPCGLWERKTIITSKRLKDFLTTSSEIKSLNRQQLLLHGISSSNILQSNDKTINAIGLSSEGTPDTSEALDESFIIHIEQNSIIWEENAEIRNNNFTKRSKTDSGSNKIFTTAENHYSNLLRGGRRITLNRYEFISHSKCLNITVTE